jgi:hypothetical protein
MFSSPRVNVIKSDTGFSVEALGLVGMNYQEGDKVAFIDSEILMTEPPSVAIWRNRIETWRPPHDNEIISEAKREEIIKNISGALRWRNVYAKII